MELAYRFTFIDVLESSPCLRRTKSAPEFTNLKDPATVESKAYVADLAVRWQKPADEIAGGNHEEGPAPLDDDMIGASAGSMQTSEIVVAAPTPPLSAGSRGHPEFCVRPCVYMAKGGCHLGAACKYCHEAHDAYPKLDKRQRTFLQRLSAFEVLSLMQPVLAQKGQQLPLARVLDMIRTEMDRLSNNAETEEIPANKQRQIQAVLKRMTAAAVLGMISEEKFGVSFHDKVRAELRLMREEHLNNIE